MRYRQVAVIDAALAGVVVGLVANAGFRFYDQWTTFPGGTNPQFHYYAKPGHAGFFGDPASIPQFTGDPKPILGEFASQHSRYNVPWPGPYRVRPTRRSSGSSSSRAAAVSSVSSGPTSLLQKGGGRQDPRRSGQARTGNKASDQDVHGRSVRARRQGRAASPCGDAPPTLWPPQSSVSQAAQPKLAMRLLEQVVSPEVLAGISLATGRIPPRRSAVELWRRASVRRADGGPRRSTHASRPSSSRCSRRCSRAGSVLRAQRAVPPSTSAPSRGYPSSTRRGRVAFALVDIQRPAQADDVPTTTGLRAGGT